MPNVENPYDWEPIQEMIATAYAAGRSDQRLWPVGRVKLSDFLAAVKENGVRFADYQALYERMARGETTETERKAA